jgi:purine-binding chemotaxis protein CheW
VSESTEDTGAAAPDLAHERELLRRRALELARVPRREREQDATTMILFRLGDDQFAIPISCVMEVAVLRELTPLPGAPAPLFGVTHWRGQVLTVLDLRELLGVRVRGLTDLGRILVLEGATRRFGVVADAVTDMIDMEDRHVRPLPDDGGEDSLLRGATKDGLLIIDAGTLLQRYGTWAG